MGRLSGVLLPLATVRGVERVADRPVDATERELYDPDTLRARLGVLNRAYEAGELGEEEFEREEERLLDLLEQRPAHPAAPGDPDHPNHPDQPPSQGSGS